MKDIYSCPCGRLGLSPAGTLPSQDKAVRLTQARRLGQGSRSSS